MNTRQRRLTATNPNATALNVNQPACEWKPPNATAGETRAPRATNATIRAAFASQITSVPTGNNQRA